MNPVNLMKPTILHPAVLVSLLFVLLLSGCSHIPMVPTETWTGKVKSWTGKVKSHLNESEGGRLLAQSMDAHGGLENWLNAGVLEFRWTYHMSDMGPDKIVDTLQQVDPSTLKAAHQVPGTDTTFGWDGTEAWISPPDAEFPTPPRFWALTPYYFVGIPFVFGDVNARFQLLEDIEFQGKLYNQVKVTYLPGSGDAPDDYYIILIQPESKLVAGARYIVTSPLVAKGGPPVEKLITLEAYAKYGGLLIPTYHRTFKMGVDGDPDAVGEMMRFATTKEIRWRKDAVLELIPPADAKRL